MTAKTVHLIACVKTKAAGPRAAKDLYRSDWFRKARAYVEAQGGPWFILSAQHGLLDPEAFIAPYDDTLLTMPRSARMAWATRVHAALLARRLTPSLGARVVILAGARYREFLEPWLAAQDPNGARVEIPMRGLGLGQQLAWLKAHQVEPPPPSPPAGLCTRHDAIEPMLVVSTAHVRPVTLDALTRGARGVAPHRVIAHAYGAIVHVGEPAPCAPDLAPILDQARAQGCDWVNLDHDASAYPGLALYAWDLGAAA